jgi:SAM-dependent MidA family methyltransferase
MKHLPIPSAGMQTHSEQLRALIQHRMIDCDGWISFEEFMQMALYSPGLGYYSAGLQKFAEQEKGGDFITAPEMSPLFANTIARQAEQIVAFGRDNHLDFNILELGAGTGKLAKDLLLELATLKQLPKQYFILEVS